MEVKTYIHPNLSRKPARNLVNLIMKMMLVFMVVSLSSTSLFGQTLNTDVEMPTLDACGAPQVFTVKIARGNTACDNGSLTIALPAGVEYIATSAKVDGITVEEAEVTPA